MGIRCIQLLPILFCGLRVDWIQNDTVVPQSLEIFNRQKSSHICSCTTWFPFAHRNQVLANGTTSVQYHDVDQISKGHCGLCGGREVAVCRSKLSKAKKIQQFSPCEELSKLLVIENPSQLTYIDTNLFHVSSFKGGNSTHGRPRPGINARSPRWRDSSAVPAELSATAVEVTVAHPSAYQVDPGRKKKDVKVLMD